jgi:hypothetical protein
MKLIFTYCWGDEGCSGTAYIPFEYESKEKFVFDMLEKYPSKIKNYPHAESNSKTEYETAYYRHETISLFGNYVTQSEIDSLEHNVSTLEEWFERNKTDVNEKP